MQMDNFREKTVIEYIDIIDNQLSKRSGEESLEQLESLFERADFVEILKAERIDLILSEKRKRKKDNKKVVDYLLKALCELVLDTEENKNIEFLYFYLKEKQVRKSNKNLGIMVFLMLVITVIGYYAIRWQSVDFILMLVAPSKEEICKEMEERYDMKVMPEDINVSCRTNDNRETNKEYLKMVTYTIPAELNDESFSFTVKWIPEQKLSSDLEMLIIEEYMEQNFISIANCKSEESVFRCDVIANITDADSKEKFLKQFEGALEEVFAVPYITKRFYGFEFTVSLGEYIWDGNIEVYIGKDDMQEKLEILSVEIDKLLSGETSFWDNWDL